MLRTVARLLTALTVLTGSVLIAAPARAADPPGVYDITFNRSPYPYPASGTMSMTYRLVLPDGGTAVGDPTCIFTIGSTERTRVTPCRSGVPFTYDLGSVGHQNATVEVDQPYDDPVDHSYIHLAYGTSTIDVDGIPPTASVSGFQTFDGSATAPTVMPPSTQFRAQVAYNDNVAVRDHGCHIDRLSPAPVVTITYLSSCGGGQPSIFQTPGSSGTYSYILSATDYAGSTTTGARTFTVDADAPVVTLTAGPGNGGATKAASVQWSWTTDESGTFSCWAGPSGGTVTLTGCSSPFTANGLAEGASQLVIKSTDGLGNAATTTYAFTVDRTKPVVSVSSPTAGATYSSRSVPLSTSLSEVATLQCSSNPLAGSPTWGPCGSEVAATHNGSYDLGVRAVDAAGNVSDPVVRTFTVDVPGPVLSITGLADGARTNATAASWSWSTPTAGATYRCAVAATAAALTYSDCTSPFATTGLTDGDHVFGVQATEPGFGTSTTLRSFTVDTTKPTVSVTSGPADGTSVTASSTAFTFASDDPQATFECSFGRTGQTATFTSCAAAPSFPLAEEGTYLLSVRSRDLAGNVSDAVTRSRIVPPLTGAPAITGTSRVGQVLTATGTWSDGVALSYAWLRNGAPIAGATEASYVLSAADLKAGVSVSVTGTRAGFTPRTFTSAPVLVVAGVLTSGKARITAPALKVGRTISASASPWPKGTTVKVQWLRGGKVIKGATKATLKLTGAMVGAKLTVRITGTLKGYTTKVLTVATKKAVAR